MNAAMCLVWINQQQESDTLQTQLSSHGWLPDQPAPAQTVVQQPTLLCQPAQPAAHTHRFTIQTEPCKQKHRLTKAPHIGQASNPKAATARHGKKNPGTACPKPATSARSAIAYRNGVAVAAAVPCSGVSFRHGNLRRCQPRSPQWRAAFSSSCDRIAWPFAFSCGSAARHRVHPPQFANASNQATFRRPRTAANA